MVGKRLKPLTYDAIEIPERFSEIRVATDDATAKAYAFAVDDYDPWYFGEDTPWARQIANPLAVVNEALWIYLGTYDRDSSRNIHARDALRLSSPIFPGEVVTVDGAFVEKYERRGRRWVVLDSTARGEDGRLLFEQRSVEIVDSGRASARSGRPDTTRSEAASSDAEGGAGARSEPVEEVLATLYKHVTQDQMTVYSWGGRDWQNLHTSAAAARLGGYDKPLVQGMQQVSYVSELCGRIFGSREWMTTGRLDVKFVGAAFAGDRLAVRATAPQSPAADGSRIDVSIERGPGALTLVGSAWLD